MGSSLIAVSVRTGLNCRTPSWRCREFLGVGENPHVWRQKCRECDSGGGIKETHWRSVDFSLHKTKRKVAQVEKSRCASTSTKREQTETPPSPCPLCIFLLSHSLLLDFGLYALQNQCSPTHLCPHLTPPTVPTYAGLLVQQFPPQAAQSPPDAPSPHRTPVPAQPGLWSWLFELQPQLLLKAFSTCPPFPSPSPTP